MKNLLYILFFLLPIFGFTQTFTPNEQLKIDSFITNTQNITTHDTTKIRNYLELTSIYYLRHPDSAIYFCEKAKIIAEKINDQDGLINSYGWLGYLTQQMGNIKGALEYTHKSLKLIENSDKTREIAILLNNIGYIYSEQGEFKEAISYFNKGLKAQFKINDTSGIATSYNNLGLIFDKQRHTQKALEYYKKSLVLRKQINDKKGIARCMSNIGSIYRKQGNLDTALTYYQKSLAIDNETFNKPGQTVNYFQIALIHLKKDEIADALLNAEKSFAIANELKFPDEISMSSKLLSEIYEKQGRGKEALKMFKLHIAMRDSIHNESTQKATAQQQAKYEYEKQKVLDDAEYEKLITIEQEAKAKQKIITYSITGSLGLVVVFLIFVFNRLQITRKQKAVIEIQKTVVEKAHSELEEKNKEITDSITYAKRIQNAILPSTKTVKEYLPNNFILYLPKDIIAGDFYWMEAVSFIANEEQPVPKSRKVKQSANNEKITSSESFHSQNRNDVILFAAADCTGHGVPGAMVSVVCNNALNRAVREYGLTNPAEILNKTRELVIQEFEKSNEDVKDGMDISLCSLKLSESYAMLQYAGANNPLWVIRNRELIEHKGDKQPIGKVDNPQPFTTHTLDLQQGDTFYIFTDGFADQFGGQKGKKFMYKPFKELLISIQDKTMDEQKVILEQHFEEWKGSLEQVDDVCIIGVRI